MAFFLHGSVCMISQGLCDHVIAELKTVTFVHCAEVVNITLVAVGIILLVALLAAAFCCFRHVLSVLCMLLQLLSSLCKTRTTEINEHVLKIDSFCN